MRGRVNDLVNVGELLEREPGFSVQLAERWLRIRNRDGKMQPLIANAAQLAFEKQRGRQNIVLKARQMGMTTWIAGRFFLRTITKPGTMSLLVAHSRAAAEAMFCTVERMWQCLPGDLCEGPLVRSRANAGQMLFPLLGSEFRIASAADENAGRGLSVQNLHCSEVSRWPGDAAATLAGLRAALAPDGELVLESTPNGAYGAFYEEWLRGERTGCTARESGHKDRGLGIRDREMVRHFLPWWMEPVYVDEAVDASSFDEEEVALVERHGLSAEQIGFRRELKKSFGVLQPQEFAEDAETCFRATGACCFDVDAIEARMMHAPEPLERRRAGALLVWLPRVASKKYVVAVDSAGGGSDGDYAAIQVIERSNGMQCAELQEKLRPVDAAREAAKLAREYNDALLVVERNNHGAALLAHLELSEKYDHVYRENGEGGWLTTSLSKAEMVARMSLLLSNAAERFMSKRLLAECRTFVSGENGRASAARGAHDDLVMSMAIGQMAHADIVLCERWALAVTAVQAIRRMRGGAQSQLMLGDDGNLWVVKFQNNPQGLRVLANELIATRLVEAVGITTPNTDVVAVSPWLVNNSPDMLVDRGRGVRERCAAGLQFGSKFVGGLMPGQVVDYLPEPQMEEVRNFAEFAGVLVVDKWTGNCNGRQAVFERKPRERKYRAVFIDQGFCFNAGEWTFPDVALRGVFPRNLVYARVRGWESFEPWLSRVEEFPARALGEIAEAVPPEWYGGDWRVLEQLMEALLVRRGKVRDLITAFRESSRDPFPNWGKVKSVAVTQAIAGVAGENTFLM